MLWLAIVAGCGGEPAVPMGPVTWAVAGPDQVMSVGPSDKWPSIAVSPSGKMLAARTTGGVHVFEADRSKAMLRIPPTRECAGDDCPHNTLAWLDEDRLVVLTYGSNMRPWYSLWNVRNKEQVSFGDVGGLEVGLYDQGQPWHVALAGAWNTERVPILIDVETGRRYAPRVDITGLADDQHPDMQAVSPDGKTLVWADHQGFVNLSDSIDGSLIKTARVTPSTTMKVTQLQWSPSGESIFGLADKDAVMAFEPDLTRRFGLNVKHPPKLVHGVDDERVLFWTDVGLFCLNTLNAEVGDGWGKALGPAAIASSGDRAWVNIGGQGVIMVDLDAFCPTGQPPAMVEPAGVAPTSP